MKLFASLLLMLGTVVQAGEVNFALSKVGDCQPQQICQFDITAYSAEPITLTTYTFRLKVSGPVAFSGWRLLSTNPHAVSVKPSIPVENRDLSVTLDLWWMFVPTPGGGHDGENVVWVNAPIADANGEPLLRISLWLERSGTISLLLDDLGKGDKGTFASTVWDRHAVTSTPLIIDSDDECRAGQYRAWTLNLIDLIDTGDIESAKLIGQRLRPMVEAGE